LGTERHGFSLFLTHGGTKIGRRNEWDWTVTETIENTTANRDKNIPKRFTFYDRLCNRLITVKIKSGKEKDIQ